MSGNGIPYDVGSFLREDFLLENSYAQTLYFDYAAQQPIIDYHNHLPPAEVAANRTFENITQLWLQGDHYKWRAMRTHGVDEYYITGEASDEEKFRKWAATVPYTMRNPLYHWSHLELDRYFGIQELLRADNATKVYQRVNEQLQDGRHNVLGLLAKMKVEIICTTDDPLDSLEHHLAHAATAPQIKMYPAFRPDKAILINDQHFLDYVQKLGEVVGTEIRTYEQLVAALEQRMDFFHERGCRISDHGLNSIRFELGDAVSVARAFAKAISGQLLSSTEIQVYQTQLLIDLCRAYHTRGWVQQFHLGALRNNNKRMLATLGPDTGWDSIGDFAQAEGLAQLLNALDATDQLGKTIIYNLNPRDNEVFASMIGNFNDGSVAGKIQWGSGWWFLDQLDGMEKQINALSNMGLISHFVGMLTDSRSFMSFPRHEYFRRLLCNIFGRDIERGLLPKDLKWIGHLITNICYHNVRQYIFEDQDKQSR